jgi:hypothetical protein
MGRPPHDLAIGPRHPALAVIALIAHPPAAPRAGRPAAAGAGREPGGTARRRRLPRRAVGRAATGERIAFAISARRIAPLGRLPAGAAQDDWREAVGIDAAQTTVADYRPGWWPANASLLLRRARAGC